MKEFLVTCITKPNRMSPHEHITHIGNIDAGWRLTREEAIRRLDARPQTEAFYTLDRTTGRKVYIGVVPASGLKGPYLRTHADGKWNDNLLSLSECNGACKLIA
jgi:hypothetical protein